jgi:UDP-2,3-diacylglucosamine pyrophosphatase LpxH
MSKGFICIGDTHGNHRLIAHRVKSLKLENETFFHVGDFGVGFCNTEHEDVEKMAYLNKILKKHNCHCYVIRGNHDDPNYFQGNHDYSNLHLMPDYSVVEINGEKVLMVGGGISVDRKGRKETMLGWASHNIDKACYWYDEEFVLKRDILEGMSDIDYVVTHSSPKFVHPINNTNNGIDSHGPFIQRLVWEGDDKLKDDLNKEREDITTMYNILSDNNNIKKWFYGHFHCHKKETVDGTDFVLLDCDEFYDVKQTTKTEEK